MQNSLNTSSLKSLSYQHVVGKVDNTLKINRICILPKK